jgi:hypothetical protein
MVPSDPPTLTLPRALLLLLTGAAAGAFFARARVAPAAAYSVLPPTACFCAGGAAVDGDGRAAAAAAAAVAARAPAPAPAAPAAPAPAAPAAPSASPSPAAPAPAAAPAAPAKPAAYEQPPAKKRGWFNAAALGGFVETPLAAGPLAAAAGPRGDKWIVLTTINAPTDAVARLAALPGWRVVVVGDSKTPADWAWPNVTFLPLAAQAALGFSTEPLLRTRAYTRKNLGYLYAVQHGATTIYETDDDNALTAAAVPLIPLDAAGAARVREYVRGGAAPRAPHVNHHALFGQPSTWPRGLPLGAAAAPLATATREVTLVPAVQQGLADGDPDMDAVFRLTRKPAARRVDFSFAAAPPVALPRGSFAPFNAQNTVFTRAALWATVLPQSVEFRVCDIWRAYWAQRLLWGVGARLTFVAPYVYQLRNAHNYQGDYESEVQIYEQADDLLAFLGAWVCASDGARALKPCALQLARDMATAGFWAPSDVELIRHFFHDLERAGYEFPAWVEEKGAAGGAALSAPAAGAAGALVDVDVESRESIALYGTCGEAVPAEGREGAAE